MGAPDDELSAMFERLVETNRTRLGGIARAYGAGHAEDLLQEMLLQIWRTLPRLRNQRYADTWCYRVAVNTAISWRRRQRRHLAVNVDDEVWAHSPSNGAEPHDPSRGLYRFLDSLSEVDRALMLMLLEDMDYAAISTVLGLSAGAVRVRVHRLKKRLSEWEE